MVFIELDSDKMEYAPGGVVRGRVRWELDAPPRALSVRLFWYTDGRGTRNVGIVDAYDTQPMGGDNEERFELPMPAGPYTCAGALVSIQWAVEAVIDDGRITNNVDITVSPWVETLQLNKLPEKPENSAEAASS